MSKLSLEAQVPDDTSSKASILTLAVELRLEIYAFHFDTCLSRPVIVTNGPRTPMTRVSSDTLAEWRTAKEKKMRWTLTPDFEHPLLRVCKAFRAEAIELFYNKATFHYSETTLPFELAFSEDLKYRDAVPLSYFLRDGTLGSRLEAWINRFDQGRASMISTLDVDLGIRGLELMMSKLVLTVVRSRVRSHDVLEYHFTIERTPMQSEFAREMSSGTHEDQILAKKARDALKGVAAAFGKTPKPAESVETGLVEMIKEES